MSEETEAPTPEVTAEPTPAPVAQATPGFSQADLDAAAAKARAQGKRQAKKEFEAQLAQQSTPEPTPSTEQTDDKYDAVMARLDAMAAQTETANFESAVSGLAVSDDERKMLSLAYKSDRELFDRKVAALRTNPAAPPEPKGPGFSGVGAPNPQPTHERETNPLAWTKDDIAVMQKEGTFLKRLKEYRNTLPGGGGGLFPAKNPMKGAG